MRQNPECRSGRPVRERGLKGPRCRRGLRSLRSAYQGQTARRLPARVLSASLATGIRRVVNPTMKVDWVLNPALSLTYRALDGLSSTSGRR